MVGTPTPLHTHHHYGHDTHNCPWAPLLPGPLAMPTTLNLATSTPGCPGPHQKPALPHMSTFPHGTLPMPLTTKMHPVAL